ncbi:hypothetical protein, partial [Pseudomonas viridiflava]|uniref:hypothetical protein n=1 Tax=Pseudomonas viridiflava TaxID=33069 RepID=UPI001980B3DA
MNNKFIKSALMVMTIAAVCINTSCKKYLDDQSPSTSSPDVVFENLDNTNAAIIGVYNRLCGDNGYGSRISTLFGLTADDFKTSGSYS